MGCLRAFEHVVAAGDQATHVRSEKAFMLLLSLDRVVPVSTAGEPRFLHLSQSQAPV